MGNGDSFFLIYRLVEPIGATGGFVAEKQSIAVDEISFPEGFRDFCGEEPDTFGFFGAFEEILPRMVMDYIEGIPIIHPAALEVAIRNFEP